MFGGEPKSNVNSGYSNVNRDYSAYKKNNYIVRPLTFSGDPTQFKWGEIKMYTHIIGLDDKLWNIPEDCNDIEVDELGIMADKKSLTSARKNIYRKHHKVRGNLVYTLPYSEYLEILNKSTAKTIC